AGDDERLGVCLDTCHSFASGYELRSAAGVDSTVEEFERQVGFDRLALVRANDSVVELGAARDRHANIGEGCIGAAGFARLLEHPRLRAVPWILEVPGDGQGPDLKQVNRLRELAGLPTVAPEAVALKAAPR
ncbi:MAG TPA: TIM barrel protein, partial [Candidatus Dormibacteraeota bacterium]|nr:TIM barrel protein [Candidatus Dormibacteraeota bacterium]